MSVTTAILNWLRAGYPDGVPATDYFPILALLNRQLNQAEVQSVVDALLASGDEVSRVDIGVAVSKITSEVPSEADMLRVAHRLADHAPHLIDPDTVEQLQRSNESA